MKVRFWVAYLGIMLFSLSVNYLAISDESLDIETIIAGLENYNELIKSGEADIIYKLWQYNKQDKLYDSMVMKSHLTFDGDKTLFKDEEVVSYRSMVFPKQVRLSKKTGVLSEFYHENKLNEYIFQSDPFDGVSSDMDPRRLINGVWNQGPLSEYIVKKGFNITSKEIVDEKLCYILEAKGNQEHEKIWIAPECGFGYLKHEHWMPFNIPLAEHYGTPGIIRRWITYQQNGGAWFPEKVLVDVLWIDNKGKEHLARRKEVEIKNLNLNCKIPVDKFLIEIPDGVTIWVSDLNRFISKQEFLKLYSAFMEE